MAGQRSRLLQRVNVTRSQSCCQHNHKHASGTKDFLFYLFFYFISFLSSINIRFGVSSLSTSTPWGVIQDWEGVKEVPQGCITLCMTDCKHCTYIKVLISGT